MMDNGKEDPPSFWRVMAENFVEGEKDALRFARGGAFVGTILGAGLGFYLFNVFGLLGVGACLLAGFVIGGIGAWLFYQLA